jgi:ferritin-like metal-binding protein YciE
MKNTELKSKSDSTISNYEGMEQIDVEKGLNDLFIDEIKDIYYAEKALTKAIPKMIKNSTTLQLTEALTEHLEVTKLQVGRLEEVFSILGERVAAKKCEAIVGLLKEGDEIMEETEDGIIRDAGIIAAGMKIEHYEIASYSALQMFAITLGKTDAAKLLKQTLEEEVEASNKLAEIYELMISEMDNNEDKDKKKSNNNKK